MIQIGKLAPPFRLQGCFQGKVKEYSLSGFKDSWLVLFFYPADFTFICPTEVLGFEKRIAEFRSNRAAVAGISTDKIELHIRWAEELGGLSYPLLSDSSREISRLYGVLDETESVAQRATFILNPERAVLFAMITSMNVGRSVEETLRVLQALQSGRLCPADWKPGGETGDTALRY